MGNPLTIEDVRAQFASLRANLDTLEASIIGQMFPPPPVVTPPMADFAFHIKDLAVNFLFTGHDADSVLWEFGDGMSGSGQSILHVYAKAGSYPVSCSAMNGGLTSIKSLPVAISAPVVIPPPVPDLPSLTVSYLPNDDSVKVAIVPFAGAMDYRVYLDPHEPKYAGGSHAAALSDRVQIEFNGLEPGKSYDLTVEAVNALGPYMYIDDRTVMPPCDDPLHCGGCEDPACASVMFTNGHGDPANRPQAIAKTVLTVTPVARVLTGAQAFFETFRTPLTFKPVAQDPRLNVDTSRPIRLDSERWTKDLYLTRPEECRSFLMHNHSMDILADFNKTGYATISTKPKIAPADISGGKVLHIFGEWDAHNGGRRWQDVPIFRAGGAISQPAWNEALRNPFADFTGLMVTFQRYFIGVMQFDEASTYAGWNNSGILAQYKWVGNSPGFNTNETPKSYAYFRQSPQHLSVEDPLLLGLENGTDADNDNRHGFDIYLSRTRIKVFETVWNGVDAVPPPRLKVDWTLAMPLSYEQIEFAFCQQFYHSALEQWELANAYAQEETLWKYRTPFTDQRHWDNLGREVLSAMP